MRDVWAWIKHSLATLGKGKGLSPSHLALILLFIGPAISYLALPIEGEYWATLMPDRFQDRAYRLAFALDFVGGFLMYVFGRVRLSASKSSAQHKLSFLIIPFVVFGVLTSAFVNWRQLVATMALVEWWEPLVIASIQPGMQLGINVAQAVVEGKFEKQPTVTVDSQPIAKEPALAPIETPKVLELALDERRDLVLAAMLSPEPPNQTELADRLNVSRGTIYNDVTALRETGRLNGQGGH